MSYIGTKSYPIYHKYISQLIYKMNQDFVKKVHETCDLLKLDVNAETVNSEKQRVVIDLPQSVIKKMHIISAFQDTNRKSLYESVISHFANMAIPELE